MSPGFDAGIWATVIFIPSNALDFFQADYILSECIFKQYTGMHVYEHAYV